MYRVLFVDDDVNILQINRNYFTPRGYEVETADNAADALRLVQSEAFDCIVLDIILPSGGDGYQLCRQIREISNTPILFLTSLTEQDFLYQGFICGGDDFLTKPYDLKELQLRIEARIQRAGGSSVKEQIFSYPPLSVNLSSRVVTMSGQQLSLTGGEMDILALLCSHPNQVFSPNEIYNQVWEMPGLDATHTVQVHISHLRRKLEAACPDHKFIRTAWGKGYFFAPAPR